MNLAEYVERLSRDGVLTLPGASSTFWVRYESFGLARLPTFDLSVPERPELRRVLWRGHAGVAGYAVQPDERHPPNAYWYVCADPCFDLGRLAPPVRRHVKRAERQLRLTPLTADELLAQGLEPFHDTRERNYLSDGTPEVFRGRFARWLDNSGHQAWGVWSGAKLAGFATVVCVDDWTEISGLFSANAFLDVRPNNGLLFGLLRHYLVTQKLRLVTFGFSSIQRGSSSHCHGLHVFKTRAGFEARPVHRAFAIHPLLRPFAQRLTLAALRQLLKLRPGSRRLLKVAGVLTELADSREPVADSDHAFKHTDPFG